MQCGARTRRDLQQTHLSPTPALHGNLLLPTWHLAFRWLHPFQPYTAPLPCGIELQMTSALTWHLAQDGFTLSCLTWLPSACVAPSLNWLPSPCPMWHPLLPSLDLVRDLKSLFFFSLFLVPCHFSPLFLNWFHRLGGVTRIRSFSRSQNGVAQIPHWIWPLGRFTL